VRTVWNPSNAKRQTRQSLRSRLKLKGVRQA
jgi:hypothetical protein